MPKLRRRRQTTGDNHDSERSEASSASQSNGPCSCCSRLLSCCFESPEKDSADEETAPLQDRDGNRGGATDPKGEEGQEPTNPLDGGSGIDLDLDETTDDKTKGAEEPSIDKSAAIPTEAFEAGRAQVPLGDVPTSMEGGRYEEIKRQCLAAGTLYEDPDFPADYTVLYTGGYRYSVQWKRPAEISYNPVYIKNGLSHCDIHQGSLGNCWFIASVAALAASPQQALLTRVVPTDQGFDAAQYCGAFRFHFWSYGKWQEVVIDDRLPTFRGELMYAVNATSPEEYWCPLLEKAFAKFYGSYDELDGGRIHTSLVDLTGGLGELVELGDTMSDSQLGVLLLAAQLMNSFMGGAIFVKTDAPGQREVKKDNGLYEGHAYSIINVKEVQTTYKPTTLIHLRNPWGKGEWNGAWSDGSTEWETLSEEDKKSTFKTQDDGEFWMCAGDFKENFDELELCHLSPDALSQEIADNLQRSQWKKTEHYGAWVKGVSAGGSSVAYMSTKFWSNPQYSLSLSHATKRTTVVVSLLVVQDPDRLPMDDVSIRFDFYQVKEGQKARRITTDNFQDFTPRLVATSGVYWPYRERTVRVELEPADYVIVPYTLRSDKEAEFYLRIFTEGDILSEPIEEEKPKPSPKPEPSNEEEEEVPTPTEPQKTATEEALDEVFDKKSDDEDLVDAEDLVEIFTTAVKVEETDHKGFNEETCRCLLGLSTADNSKGLLNREGVHKVWSELELWRKAFRLVDKDVNGSVDSKELKKLFDVVDMDVDLATIDTIMARYGGRRSRVAEEEFLQSFCRAMKATSIYQDLKSKKKVDMTLNEWLAMIMQV